MKSLIISFCLSFTCFCVCLEIIYYVRAHARLKTIAKRRKQRELLCEDVCPKLNVESFSTDKGRESIVEPKPLSPSS